MYGKAPQAVQLSSEVSDPSVPDDMATALLRATKAERTHLPPDPVRARTQVQVKADADVIVVDPAGVAVAPPTSSASAADRQVRPSSAAPADAAAEDHDPDQDDPAYDEVEVEEEVAASPPPRQLRQPRRPTGFPGFDEFSALPRLSVSPWPEEAASSVVKEF
jgi:hypothetical protein